MSKIFTHTVMQRKTSSRAPIIIEHSKSWAAGVIKLAS